MVAWCEGMIAYSEILTCGCTVHAKTGRAKIREKSSQTSLRFLMGTCMGMPKLAGTEMVVGI